MATNITPGLRPHIGPSTSGVGAARPAAVSTPAEPAPVAPVPTDTYSSSAQAQPEPAGPPPSSLGSKLGGLVDVKTLAKQLASDLLTQSAALFGKGALTRDVKATRLMEFVVPYAQRFAELKQVAPLDPKAAEEAMARMLKPMLLAGLGQVIETSTRRTGPQVAKELLTADSPEDVSSSMEGLRFDSTDPAGLIAQPLQAQATPVLRQARVAEAEVDQASARGREEQARLQAATWGGWARFRSDVGRAMDAFKWNTGDRLLVGLALGTLGLAMLVAALLTLLR